MNPLPDSQSHRLCAFPGAPLSHRQATVPNYIADEVEDLREFIAFLYPPRGQTRFKLHAPDVLELRWTVCCTGSHSTFTFGDTPRDAVRAARMRLKSEEESERTMTPFSLPETEEQPKHVD
jgi:hypothetical protein